MQLGWRCESNRFKLDAGVMLIRKLIPQMHRAFVIQSPGMRPTKFAGVVTGYLTVLSGSDARASSSP